MTIAQPDVRLPDGYRLAELGESDRDAILDVDSWAFGVDFPPDVLELLPFPLEAGRTVGVWAPHLESGDPPALAAVHGSFRFDRFQVPGGTLATAGLTWVGVHPAHRRRGLARAMVEAHLHRTRARGEAVSALFAAEPAIYGRFGYGCAAQSLRLTIRRGAPLRDVPGAAAMRVAFERAEPGRHETLVAGIHAAVVRPGWPNRSNVGLRRRPVLDVPAWRDGAEALRIAVVRDRAGEPRGYATFQRKEHWNGHGSPDGTVRVRESATLDAAAARALWGALTDLDLMGSVETHLLAVDDPLLHLLVDVRTAAPVPVDNLWVRLVDLPRALGGRRYASAVDVVLEVADDVFPENAGRWRLRGGLQGAEVVATTASADIALDVRELGAAYLGGTPLAALGAAGLVSETTPGALGVASTAFGWPVAPACNFIF